MYACVYVHKHVEGGTNLKWIPQAIFPWRLPGRLGDWPTGRDQSVFALLALRPLACTTKLVGFGLVWFGFTRFWGLNSGPNTLPSKHLID